MRGLLVLALSVACGAACDLNSWDPPLKPTPEYPCTAAGVVCSVQHTCCPQGSVCGGEPYVMTCPAGQCCAEGDTVFGGARTDAGSVQSTPQRPFNR